MKIHRVVTISAKARKKEKKRNRRLWKENNRGIYRIRRCCRRWCRRRKRTSKVQSSSKALSARSSLTKKPANWRKSRKKTHLSFREYQIQLCRKSWKKNFSGHVNAWWKEHTWQRQTTKWSWIGLWKKCWKKPKRKRDCRNGSKVRLRRRNLNKRYKVRNQVWNIWAVWICNEKLGKII